MVTGMIPEEKLRLRAMEPEDIAAVLEIDRNITGQQRAITYTDLITGDLGGVLGLSFVAEVAGKVVGFILARHAIIGATVGEVGLVQILGVDPAYWHQGIGTRLVSALLERCEAKGLKTVRILINEGDSRLKKFFKHLSFHRGELIDYVKDLK